MCKHVLVPMKQTVDAAVQKSCKPALLSRVWLATRRALNLDHTHPHHFACSQWQTTHRPSTLYLVYRFLLFILIVSTAISSLAYQRLPRKYEGPPIELNYWKWFIYFTNWGFLMIAVQSGLALAVVLKYRSKTSYNIPSEEDELPMSCSRRVCTPLLCRAYWLAHNIATDLAFVITCVYWTLVHDPALHEVNTLNVLVHGGNSLIMFVEICVTAHPIRAAHALYGAGAGLAYGVFSAIYWALGGTDRLGQPAIYPNLDWNKPGSAFGFVALCAAVMVVAHVLASGAAWLRGRIARNRRALPTH